MERLGGQLFLAMRSARTRFEQHLSDAGGSLAQWGILKTLASDRPKPSQRELSDLLALGGSTTTHHLDRLEQEGLVARRRDERDRRVVRVAITPKGRRHLARLERAADAADEELRGLLPAREAERLQATLGRLAGRLEELRAEDAAS
ncbi:MAG: winged helix-turn-helix transcriptional regulator [Actinobacteria bacterium]|nr:winged helix-turn-helix transcriptional regulator [Actinomycetota bacterium]